MMRSLQPGSPWPESRRTTRPEPMPEVPRNGWRPIRPRVLAFLANGEASSVEIAKTLHLSGNAVANAMALAEEQGYVERTGVKRNGKGAALVWRLKRRDG